MKETCFILFYACLVYLNVSSFLSSYVADVLVEIGADRLSFNWLRLISGHSGTSVGAPSPIDGSTRPAVSVRPRWIGRALHCLLETTPLSLEKRDVGSMKACFLSSNSKHNRSLVNYCTSPSEQINAI